jgi:hypothetical protein
MLAANNNPVELPVILTAGFFEVQKAALVNVNLGAYACFDQVSNAVDLLAPNDDCLACTVWEVSKLAAIRID